MTISSTAFIFRITYIFISVPSVADPDHPAQASKMRVESVWTHPNRGAVLAAVHVLADTVESSGSQRVSTPRAVKFALLRVPVDDEALNLPQLKNKPGSISNHNSINNSNNKAAALVTADSLTSIDFESKQEEMDVDGPVAGGLFYYSLSVCTDTGTEPIHLDVRLYIQFHLQSIT